MAKKVIKSKKRTKVTYVPLRGLADIVAKVENPTIKTDLPDYRAGDTVRVSVRIKEGEKERIQAYEGVVIAKSNTGGSKSFTVRKISHTVGVERIFLESSPKVAKLEIIQKGRVRRAKLYYLRELEGRAARIERDIEGQKVVTAANAANAASAKAAATAANVDGKKAANADGKKKA